MLTEKLKVSVVIPVHNASRTLERCVESVLQQDYQNIEIILVNDGSTDSSLKICEHFSQNYHFVKLIDESQSGVSVARNRGVKLATGKYVCFLDADDTYQNTAFSTAMRLSRNGSVDIIMGGTQEIQQNGRILETAKFTSGISQKSYCGDELRLLKRWTMERKLNVFPELPVSHEVRGQMEVYGLRMGTVWSKFFKKGLFADLNFEPSLGFSEDLIFVYECFDNICELVISSNVFYNYYYNSSSVTHLQYNPRSISDNISLANVLWSYKQDFDDDYKDFINRKIMDCFWQSLNVGIIADQHLGIFQKYLKLKKLLKLRIYKQAFSESIMATRELKGAILSIAGKFNLGFLLLIISEVIYWRKK